MPAVFCDTAGILYEIRITPVERKKRLVNASRRSLGLIL